MQPCDVELSVTVVPSITSECDHQAPVTAGVIAWQAQKRLCARYRALSQAGKNIKAVCVAIASIKGGDRQS